MANNLNRMDIDRALNPVKNALDKIEFNTGPGFSEVQAGSFVVSGGIILSMWSQLKKNPQLEESIKNFNEAMDGMKETVQSLGPVIAPLVDWLTGLINLFNSLPDPVKQFLFVIALLIGVLIAFLGILSTISIGIIALESTLALLGGLFIEIIAPILAIVAIIILLGTAIYLAYQKFEGFRNLVDTVWAAIKAGLTALWTQIQTALTAIANFFIAQWQRVLDWWNEMLPTFMAIWNAIWAFLQPIVAIIVEYVKLAFENLKTIFIAAWEIIKTIIMTAWEIIKAIISAAIGVVMSIISAFAYLLTGQWGKAWQSVLDIFRNIGAMLVSIITSLFNGLLSILSSLIGLVGGIFRNMWNGVIKITGQLLGGLADLIFGKVSGVGDFLRNFASNAASWGSNLINEFIKGIRSRIQGVINAVNDVVRPVRDFLGFSSPTKKGPGSYADQWAPNLMEMFTSGIRAGIPALKSVASLSMSQLAVMGQSQGTGSLAVAGSDSSAPMIHIDQMTVRNDQDIRLISQELWRLHQRQARSFGGRV